MKRTHTKIDFAKYMWQTIFLSMSALSFAQGMGGPPMGTIYNELFIPDTLSGPTYDIEFDDDIQVRFGGGVYQAGVTIDETSFPPIEDLHIERSNGWKSDAYRGEFFRLGNFVFPESFNFRSLDYSTTDNFLLLTSKDDGRQFLFVAAACDRASLDCN